LIYAPGYYTGYGVKTMPGVREGIEDGRYADAEVEITRVAPALARLNALGDLASAGVGKLARQAPASSVASSWCGERRAPQGEPHEEVTGHRPVPRRRARASRAATAAGCSGACGDDHAGHRRDAAESRSERMADVAADAQRLGLQPARSDQEVERERPP